MSARDRNLCVDIKPETRKRVAAHRRSVSLRSRNGLMEEQQNWDS